MSFIAASGRRKTAVARVRLFEGKDEIIVNGKPISQYWPGELNKTAYEEPFKTTNTLNKYTATVKVAGSGTNSQMGAFLTAISKAISTLNVEQFRPTLKKRGFLTRDPRMKETRKIGAAHGARAKRQSPKR
ncbi:30S ribosomal protein S9 [Candidatus Collierbacteria bacterium RIFOXYB1_FULL_49_13]|uniref:Small ribosomal subunit protein uS9 n=1 Tax=Candidatus Collierbacteria bacterium RIFOXYB1_FULL_49_13 TaxID=1817728 RepID=A0A1F5FHT0_9BACT|nr:MAG: 30S ribosomal protein S9 [Candidatus Collierbacteria bacterium RIFOXYB1_FULL_49_13]